MQPDTDLAVLTNDLDLMVHRLTELYHRATRLEASGRLAGAARVPDELARSIASTKSCRNAVAFEAYGLKETVA